MSIEGALNAAHEVINDERGWPEGYRHGPMSDALDRLILEVQAAMPCYKLVDDHYQCDGEEIEAAGTAGADLGIFTDTGCVSCVAKAKLFTVTATTLTVVDDADPDPVDSP